MNFVKRALLGVGCVTLVAVVVNLVAPHAAHALVAALVQIVPGTATHVGQNESRIINLACSSGNNFCVSVDSSGNGPNVPYQVPAGLTLIVTDYEFSISAGPSEAGIAVCDHFFNKSTFASLTAFESCSVADRAGQVFGTAHFTTGIRVGSGITIQDVQTSFGGGSASMQGYLVPND